MSAAARASSGEPGRWGRPAKGEGIDLDALLPLLPDVPADAIVAYREAGPVRAADFLIDVGAVARALPEVDAALNLCQDRYWFAVSFMACISRGILSLFPNANAPQHLAFVQAQSPGCVALGDQAERLTAEGPWLRVDEMARHAASMPASQRDMAVRMSVPAGERVARFFTSGSTGQPKPCDKFFGRLHAGHRAAARRIQSVTGGPRPVVGTSSFRHMFGFEATVTLPLWSGVGFGPDTPFFPADVAESLARLPEPGLLVTTPYHLRKMLEADIAFPRCAGLLSATAPLSAALAEQAEARFQAPLLEVYGSTELGMMATRRTSLDEAWQVIEGFALRAVDEGFEAHGPALDAPQPLHDLVEPLEAGRFRMIDRSSNLINVVGKRSSLGFLNQVLQGLPGVQDGVFCLPPDAAHHDVSRLAAFVVAPGLTQADILSGLRPHLDPVFLPRPIVLLDALPRDANAKLPAAAMQALVAEHLSRKA